jgi:hypothetical protein
VKDVRLSGFTSLEPIGHGGQIKHGDLTESSESYRARTYGRQFVLTREMIINDDLGAFLRIPSELGNLARRNIDDVVYALLISASGVGPTMNEDGQALFSAAHVSAGATKSNYSTGSGSALGTAGMTAARKLLRKMTGDAGEILNLRAKYLLVPSDLEAEARTLLTSSAIVGYGGSTAKEMPSGNIYQGSTELIVEPRLDSATNGTTAWYLLCDPAQLASIVIVALNGNLNPTLRPVNPGNVLGEGYQMYHDVGAAAVNWRGAIRSKGTT